MESCRFCFESISPEAVACRHCGHWQPTKDEINSAYRGILRTLVWEDAERKRNGLNTLTGSGLFSFIALLYWEVTPIYILIFSIFLGWLYFKLERKCKAKIALENALLIEERLQNKLREQQVKKFQSQKTSLFVFWGILLLLAISNPSTQEFQEFQKSTFVVPDKTNLVICSVYVADDKKYLGIAGNFFQVSSDSSSQQN